MMKNLIVLVFFFMTVTANAQYPVPQKIGGINAMATNEGGTTLNGGVVYKHFTDTTQINQHPYIKTIPNIEVHLVGNITVKRNNTATAWIFQSQSGIDSLAYRTLAQVSDTSFRASKAPGKPTTLVMIEGVSVADIRYGIEDTVGLQDRKVRHKEYQEQHTFGDDSDYVSRMTQTTNNTQSHNVYSQGDDISIFSGLTVGGNYGAVLERSAWGKLGQVRFDVDGNLELKTVSADNLFKSNIIMEPGFMQLKTENSSMRRSFWNSALAAPNILTSIRKHSQPNGTFVSDLIFPDVDTTYYIPLTVRLNGTEHVANSMGKIDLGTIVSGGTTETASNGLTKVVNDIKLGGSLTGITAIDVLDHDLTINSLKSASTTSVLTINQNNTTNARTLTLNGIQTSSNPVLRVANTNGGVGLTVSTSGTGYGSGLTSTLGSNVSGTAGVFATLGTGTGIIAQSASNFAIDGSIQNTLSASTVNPILKLTALNANTVAGFGTSIDTYLSSISNTSGILMTSIKSTLIDASVATLQSAVTIQAIKRVASSGVLVDVLTVQGSGALVLPQYSTLPTYADEAAAVAAGLAQNTVYKTATGELRIKL